MDIIYFLVRYTPFWSIPLLMLGGEFAYLFWGRRKRKTTLFCLVLVAFSVMALVYYYIAGGPEKSVRLLIHIIRTYFI